MPETLILVLAIILIGIICILVVKIKKLISENKSLKLELNSQKKSSDDLIVERDTLNKNLEQAKDGHLDKMKDDFVSIASHELRTPMTAIRSYAWMALHKADVPLSDKVERYLVRILISTERLINLVNDLLNVSRIEAKKIAIKCEPIDLLKVVKDVVDEAYYSKSVTKEIKFAILEQKLPPVLGEPEKLREVLLNLIMNAVKFTPNLGNITISFFTDGKVIETHVKDSGVGISKEDLGRLFQKFGKLDNSYVAASTSGGTGLGLYISKNLVELMHGRIWASSEGLNKGATFAFSLPIASSLS